MNDVKLIKSSTHGVNLPDDLSYPWRLDARFSLPEFMNAAYLFLIGDYEIIQIRGTTYEALDDLARSRGLYNHPRLLDLTITQPEA